MRQGLSRHLTTPPCTSWFFHEITILQATFREGVQRIWANIKRSLCCRKIGWIREIRLSWSSCSSVFVAFPRNLLSKKYMAARASDSGKALLKRNWSQARSVHCKWAMRCPGEAARRTIQNHHITSGARARRLGKDPAFEHCTVKMSLIEVHDRVASIRHDI